MQIKELCDVLEILLKEELVAEIIRQENVFHWGRTENSNRLTKKEAQKCASFFMIKNNQKNFPKYATNSLTKFAIICKI